MLLENCHSLLLRLLSHLQKTWPPPDMLRGARIPYKGSGGMIFSSRLLLRKNDEQGRSPLHVSGSGLDAIALGIGSTEPKPTKSNLWERLWDLERSAASWNNGCVT